MAIETAPLPVPPTADTSKLKDFGREVKGVDPGVLTPGEFQEVHDLLYKVLSMLDARELRLADCQCPTNSTALCSSGTWTLLRSSSMHLRRYDLVGVRPSINPS